MKKSRFDFTPGTKYGRLTLTGESESRTKNGRTKRFEKCICECGNIVWVVRSNLTRGNKSCGCLQREVCSKTNSTHGMTKTRIFKIFSDIKTRCYNQNREDTIVIINGEQHNLGEWSKKLGIPRETLKRHIIKGKIKGEIYRRGTGETYNYKQSMRGGKRK